MRRPVLGALIVSSLASALAACGPGEAPREAAVPPKVAVAPPPPPAEPDPAVRDDGRLPRTVTPLRYALELEIDPRAQGFRGKTRIRVDVPKPTSIVMLHGRKLHVTRVMAESGGAKVIGHAQTRRAHGSLEEDELVLRFDRPLAPGDATVAIDYDAPYGEALSGLYRVDEGERSYAFTQFEATDARGAFPCIDEPDVKVPFDVVVKVPSSMTAVSNMPEAWHVESPTQVGWTVHAFATSPPLPAYLVALAVGDLDIREGRKAPIPVRLVTVKGKAALGGAAIDATEKLVDALGDYFGIRYPYPKLDIVAIPDFAAGAMENAGLVTFREEILLDDPQHASARARRNQALTIAHELAHQWFGDLVTMKWWDDTWLNEGFATWMEAKAVDRIHPSYEATLEQIGDAQDVMDLDALSSARRVRQPVTSVGDIDEAFDGITYDKGAAVLRMLEGYAGEEPFRRGVAAYLRAHAWGNASATDLLVELDRATGKDLSSIAASFLDQTGVPSVSVERECDAKGYRLTLTQFPWQAVGAPPPKQPLPQWNVPVCIGLPGEKDARCLALRDHTTKLEGIGACPAWIHPNLDERGYYRFQLGAKEAAALAHTMPNESVASRVGALSNLWAMVRAGTLDVEVLLHALSDLDHETHPYVIEEEAEVLDRLGDTAVSDAARPAFRRFVAERLAPKKRALGWTPKANEGENTVLARRAVLFTLGETAEDDATLREADKIATEWLRDPNSVDADAGPLSLELASRRGNEARFLDVMEAARKAKLPQHRVAALRALGAFGDEKLLFRALDWTLTDEVRQQDVRYVIRAAMAHRASRPAVLAWVKLHWDAALARFTSHLAHPLIDPVAGACTREAVTDARAFFNPRIDKVEGGARPLAEALERASLCAELRLDLTAPVDRFFGVIARDDGKRGGSSKEKPEKP